jgi:AcrR family transcriptional regulator
MQCEAATVDAPAKSGTQRRPGTRLQRQLADPERFRRPTPLDAFRLARRKFLAAERIDMSALADELGVNRVTLYRWVGSREQLLVEVIWALGSRTLDNVARGVRAKGAERIVRIVTRFLEAVISNPGMRRWLAEEGELAMRLLTRHDTDFQPRLIDAIHELLREEADAGRLTLDVDLHEVAYVIVRLIESYTYLDLITGEQPDAQRAEPILRLLLR